LPQLSRELRTGIVGQAGDVSTRSRETGDEAGPDRIDGHRRNNRDRRGSPPHREGGGGARRNNDVDSQPHQLGRQLRVTFGFEVCVAVLEDDVAAVDPPERRESLGEGAIVRSGGRASSPGETTDSVDPPHWLGHGSEWGGE
jgi:hypothetical protein